MDPRLEQHLLTTRRQFFGNAGLRLGGTALAMLLAKSGQAFGDPSSATAASGGAAGASAGAGMVHPPLPGFPHFRPRAKSVIYLHMNGGPSQIDLWDYKPKLREFFDKDLPPSVQGGQRLSTMTSGQTRFPVAPSKYSFKQAGQCGRWVNTDLLPYTSKIVDDIAVIKSVNTHAINHDPACTF